MNEKVLEGIDASRRAAWRKYYDEVRRNEELLEAYETLAASHYRMLRDYWDTLVGFGIRQNGPDYKRWARRWHPDNFGPDGPKIDWDNPR